MHVRVKSSCENAARRPVLTTCSTVTNTKALPAAAVAVTYAGVPRLEGRTVLQGGEQTVSPHCGPTRTSPPNPPGSRASLGVCSPAAHHRQWASSYGRWSCPKNQHQPQLDRFLRAEESDGGAPGTTWKTLVHFHLGHGQRQVLSQVAGAWGRPFCRKPSGATDSGWNVSQSPAKICFQTRPWLSRPVLPPPFPSLF